LINVDFDLSKVFLDEMYIRLCALIGQLIENHQILSWSFSNSKFTRFSSVIFEKLKCLVWTFLV